jgi:hypothetical protein
MKVRNGNEAEYAMGSTSRDAYRWPPGAVLSFYRPDSTPIHSVRTRDLDLADTLMLNWSESKRSVIFGLRCPKHEWSWWSEELLQFAEGLIRYDLEFDGYAVKITRLTSKRGAPQLSCACEFRWQLDIKTGTEGSES